MNEFKQNLIHGVMKKNVLAISKKVMKLVEDRRQTSSKKNSITWERAYKKLKCKYDL